MVCFEHHGDVHKPADQYPNEVDEGIKQGREHATIVRIAACAGKPLAPSAHEGCHPSTPAVFSCLKSRTGSSAAATAFLARRGRTLPGPRWAAHHRRITDNYGQRRSADRAVISRLRAFAQVIRRPGLFLARRKSPGAQRTNRVGAGRSASAGTAATSRVLRT
jgi:hypothetical protein